MPVPPEQKPERLHRADTALAEAGYPGMLDLETGRLLTNEIPPHIVHRALLLAAPEWTNPCFREFITDWLGDTDNHHVAPYLRYHGLDPEDFTMR